jgi:hypothetical protein
MNGRKRDGLVLALAVGALALLPGAASANTATKHLLDVYKVEQHVTLTEGQQLTGFKVNCNPGDFATDGMWRVDHVSYNPQVDDQGPYDRNNAVYVPEAYASNWDEYTFSVHNHSEDQVQVKFWVVCLGKKTAPDTERHDLTADVTTTHTDTITGAGVLTGSGGTPCPSGQVAIAPGYQVTTPAGGHVKLFQSYPDSSQQHSWNWGFYVEDVAGVTIQTSFRCLSLKTVSTNSHHHLLKVAFRPSYFGQQTAVHNKVNALKVDCGELEKGIVGAFDTRYLQNWDEHFTDQFPTAAGPSDYSSLDPPASHSNHHWLWYLGQEPQPKSRVFHIWNSDPSTDYQVRLGLLCIHVRTTSKIPG